MKDIDLRNNRWVHLGLLLFITLLFYMPVWDFDFIIDDPYLIVDRAETLSDLSNIPSYFTKGFWQTDREHFFYYRPIITSINALSVATFGLKPGWFHLTNLLFHLLNLTLLFLILSRVLKSQWTVFWSLLIYSIHPFAVPTVAWISGRTDLFAMFFMLLSIWFFLTYIERHGTRPGRLILSIIFYFFSCLSKETAVLIPVFLLIYLLIKKEKHAIRALFFLPITALYIVIRIFVKSGIDGDIIAIAFDMGNLLIFPNVMLYYLARIFVPMNITFIPNSADILLVNPLSIALVLVVVLLALFSLWKKRYIFPILWAGIFVAPVLYILPVGYPGAAYYLYIPLIGILIIAIDLIRRLVDFLSNRFIDDNGARDKVSLVIFMLILAYFGYHGFGTLVKYSDEATLWQDSLNIEPDNLQALKNLGVMYYEQGEFQNAVGLLEKIRLAEPKMGSVYWNLIACYSHMKEYEKADIVWQDAKKEGVIMERTSINYALTLIDRDFHDEALLLLEAVRKKNPTLAEPHRYMGMIELYFRADTTASIGHFENYLALHPSDTDTAFFRDIVEGER